MLDESFVMVKRMFFSNDMLFNQISKEIPENACSFDKFAKNESKKLSKFYSLTSSILIEGFADCIREEDELRIVCGRLLHNSLNSYLAAYYLLRSGFRLQPGIIIRNVLENVSTSFHLVTHQNHLEKFKASDFNSAKTINTAKKLIPGFGRMYGFFSDTFVHIGKLYNRIEPVDKYKQGEDSLEVNISFLKFTIWFLYVVTETTYIKYLPNPKFWKLEGDEVIYKPELEVLKWVKKTLGFEVEFDSENIV